MIFDIYMQKTISMTRRSFDWTTGFDLSPQAYRVDEQVDKVELAIPVFEASKKDIKITRRIRGNYNDLTVVIPDTLLSEKRELLFGVSPEYDLTKIKSNKRDGVLYIHIPLKEEGKPKRIEIT